MADDAYAPSRPGDGYVVFAWIFLVAGLILGSFGVYRMSAYDYSDRIVGGDAYNYTILATRGVGYICAGILCVGFSATLMLMRAVGALHALAPQSASTVSAPSEAISEPAAALAVPSARRILCWNCGKEYADGLTTCPHCKKKIAMSPIYRGG